MHWSKVTNEVQWSFFIHLIAGDAHVLAGRWSHAQTGKAGCSKKEQPPVTAHQKVISIKNCIKIVPSCVCLHCLALLDGRPFGSSNLRTGGGPPASIRAAVYVSHGGPPPTPQMAPFLILSVQKVRLRPVAKSPVAPCRQKSTLTQKM